MKIAAEGQHGFWKMVHESRTDFAILLGSRFLLWVGRLSVDRPIAGKQSASRRQDSTIAP